MTARNHQPVLHQNLAKLYRRKVQRLGNLLCDGEHGREAFNLVRSLIQQVRLIPERGALVRTP